MLTQAERRVLLFLANNETQMPVEIANALQGGRPLTPTHSGVPSALGLAVLLHTSDRRQIC